jgi:hypothetical protein
MQDCEYDHAPGFNPVEDSIRKARNKCATHFTVHARKHLRIALDCVKCSIDGRKELLPKPLRLTFVITESGSQIPPDLRTVYDRESH